LGLRSTHFQGTAGTSPPAYNKGRTMTFNINTCGTSELLTVKGLGDKMAARIMVWQQDHGFEALVDVMLVRGIKGSVFGEMKKMGIVCKDALTEQEEIEMSKKEDVMSLVRHLSMIFIMGYVHRGKEWASKKKEETREMWMQARPDMDVFTMATEVAKEKFLIWQEETTVNVYETKGFMWVKTTEERLLECATNEAAREVTWKATNSPIWNVDEKAIYDEMVDTIYMESDDAILEIWRRELVMKAYKVYNPTVNKLLEAVEFMCMGQRTPDNLKRIKKAERQANRLWTRAWYEAQEILLEDAAMEPSEGLSSIDNQEDLDDTMKGDLPEQLAIEIIEGQRSNFFVEPNWLQIYYNRDKAERYIERAEDVLRELCHVKRGDATKAHRDMTARCLKQAHKMLSDVFFQPKLREQLMMENNYLGLLTKTQLIKLDKSILLVMRILAPHWKWMPKPLMTYEDHMKAKGEAEKAKVLMRQRMVGDDQRKLTHKEQMEMSMIDFGQMDDEGEWSASQVSDDNALTPEQHYMINECWFE
jgi:hypothetical protein